MLWYQRVETLPAATPPRTVRTSQTPITAKRCRIVRCARRVSIGGLLIAAVGITRARIRCGTSPDNRPEGDCRTDESRFLDRLPSPGQPRVRRLRWARDQRP